VSPVCSLRFPLNIDGKNYILGGIVMRIMRRRLNFVMLFVVILLLAFVSVSSFTAEYPKEKAIRIFNPYGAGGGVDISARILASAAQPLVDQRIDVISMPGAGGQEAINFVMNQPQDGYAFLVTDYGPLITTALTEKVGYDLSDWKPVIQITEIVPTFFVKTDSPIKDVNDWVAKAKANPNVFSVAHGRYLSVPHLPLILFEKLAGIENRHVPTTGGAEALVFVLGDHVDIGAGGPAAFSATNEAGLTRALAVCSEERISFLPDTPTMKELGYDVVLPAWFTLFAYKDVPEDRIEFIQNKFIEALNTKEAQSLAAKVKTELIPYGSEKCQGIYNATIENLKIILSDLEKK
jgi:tripartite-type tricarboxylate transporter receptor subunit TctC